MSINKEVFFEYDLYAEPNINVNKAENFPAHYHKHVEFIYVTKGRLRVTIDNETVELSPGESAFIFPYRVHEYKTLTPDGERFIIVFEPEYYRNLLKFFENHLPRSPFLKKEDLEKRQPLIDELINYRKHSTKANRTTIGYSVFLSKIGVLLSSILSDTGITSNYNKSETIYLRVVKFCCDNFANENFTIEDVVENFHISRSRIQHIFSKNTNMGIKEYINFLRLRNAEQLLINTSLSVTEVALNSGFATLRTFNRQFSQKNGVTPTQFRSAQKN